MSKEQFINILGVDYYNEINTHCNKSIGKDINDISWRDGTSWLGEIVSFLKTNFNVSVRKKINSTLGGWCHGATINDTVYEVIDVNQDETISEDIENGVRIKRNPNRVLCEVKTDINESEFIQWLQAVKTAMDYVAKKQGIQKTLLIN